MENSLKTKPCKLVWGNRNAIIAPQMSVVMPVYKKYDFLEDAIMSAVEQDFDRPYEIVIVDNNTEPNNHCLEIVKKINTNKIMYYQNETNIGMVGNGNQSALLARSNLLVFLHDDDLLLNYSLKELYNAHRDKNGALFSLQATINSKGEIVSFPVGSKYFNKISKLTNFSLFLDSISTGVGSLYKRNEFIELGGYKEDMYPSHDYKLNAEYVARFGGYLIHTCLAKVRVAENESFQVYDRYTNLCYDIRRSIIQRYNGKLVRIILSFMTDCKREFDSVNCRIYWGGEKMANISYSRWKYNLIKIVIKMERVRRFFF